MMTDIVMKKPALFELAKNVYAGVTAHWDLNQSQDQSVKNDFNRGNSLETEPFVFFRWTQYSPRLGKSSGRPILLRLGIWSTGKVDDDWWQFLQRSWQWLHWWFNDGENNPSETSGTITITIDKNNDDFDFRVGLRGHYHCTVLASRLMVENRQVNKIDQPTGR